MAGGRVGERDSRSTFADGVTLKTLKIGDFDFDFKVPNFVKSQFLRILNDQIFEKKF